MKGDLQALGLLLLLVLFSLGSVYITVAAAAFEWRNPKANRMCVFRDFHGVVMFEKMEKYQ